MPKLREYVRNTRARGQRVALNREVGSAGAFRFDTVFRVEYHFPQFWISIESFGFPLKKKKKRSKPHETDSSPVGPQPGGKGKAEAGITTNDTGMATITYKAPTAGEVVPEPETTDEEYILEREPDGRYRIVGRRLRKG